MLKLCTANETIALKVYTLKDKSKDKVKELIQRAIQEKVALTKLKGKIDAYAFYHC